MAGGRWRKKKGRVALEKEHLTGGPHLVVRGEREEGGRWTGGFNWAGRERAAAGRKKRKNVGHGEGRWAGLDRFSFKTFHKIFHNYF
jgi:hypothetical protein